MVLPVVHHQVSFWSGPDRLDGELRLPGTPGPHPVLVVVGEPDRRERDYSPWLDDLTFAGFASYTWDRPAQPTPPVPRPRRVAVQAREVLAALDRLRCLPELGGGPVALIGWGEGGWAAAQVTTFSDEVCALVLACTPGPAAAPRSGRTEPGRTEPGRTEPGCTELGRTEPDAGHHDPGPTLSAVTVPVLALFGEQDPLVPAADGVRSVRGTLRDAGHPDHDVAVVRGADHGLRVRAPHGLGPIVDGRHRFGDWPPGLTALLARWLDRALCPQPVPSFAPPLQAPLVRGGVRGRTPLPAAVPVRQVRRRVPR